MTQFKFNSTTNYSLNKNTKMLDIKTFTKVWLITGLLY